MDIRKALTDTFAKAFTKLGYDPSLALVTFSNRPEMCDFQNSSAFQISKIEKKSPMEIAQKIAAAINFDGAKIEALHPGYVNITLSNDCLSEYANNMLKQKDLGLEKIKSPKVVFFDYGGANIAKQLHIGHLRSPIVGGSLKRLYNLLGYKTISDPHLGDWGLQMGQIMAGIQEKFDCSFYFDGKTKKPNISVADLNAIYPYASQKCKTDEAFKKLAQEITVKLQNKDKAYYALWQDIKNISVADIKKEYNNLGATFDTWKGESDANEFIPKLFDILHKKKLAQISNGAEIVEVDLPSDEKPMPPVLVKSSAGADLYATSDLATIIERVQDYDPDELFYVTDNRQNLHFEQVFRVSRLAELVNPTTKLTHVGFGTICGKDGKPFKTREGTTANLDILIGEVVKKAQEKLKTNNIADDEALAKKIAYAAIKFGDLSNACTKDYIFDIDKFISFEGKTGPYLQYTATRIKSIANKVDGKFGKIAIETTEERKIVIEIIKMLASFEKCYQEKSLHPLCASLYDMASAYSSLYSNIKILTEQNESRKMSLLGVSNMVFIALKLGLYVLDIDVPEKM